MSAARAPPFPKKNHGKTLGKEFHEGKIPPWPRAVASQGGVLRNFGVYEGGGVLQDGGMDPQLDSGIPGIPKFLAKNPEFPPLHP